MSAPVALRQAARWLYHLRREDPEIFRTVLNDLDDDDLNALRRCWQLHAREAQLRPRDSQKIWLRMAGRGEGKTRSAAEHTLDVAEDWGSSFSALLCNRTIGDVRDIMIEGESGLQACAQRRGYDVRYVANRRRVEFPGGGVAFVLSSEDPEKPRGFQSNYIWGDEIASWKNAGRTLNNLMFGWRLPCPGLLGPLMVLTTTPKANEIMWRLVRDDAFAKHVTLTRGRTLDNADNLDPHAVEIMRSIYDGTKLGRQELDGELLETLGACWEQDSIHAHRVRLAPELMRRIVSLDPSIDDKEDSDAAGILVLGSDTQAPPDAFVLDDRTLEQATFSAWARATVDAFVDWNCDAVVAEVNQGGSGIREAIQVAAQVKSQELGRELSVPVHSVWARESKQARAEPIGALAERGRIHHVGIFAELEKELTTWIPGMASPNRLDALVHGVSHLILGDETVGPIGAYY